LNETIFLDGYNCIFLLFREIESLEEQRQALIERLAGCQQRVIVVFDGQADYPADQTHVQGLEVVFTSKKESADDYIIHEVEHTPAKVVTRDRRLAMKVREHGREVIDPIQFFSTAESPPCEEEPSISFSEEEFRRWLHQFQKRLADNERGQ